MTMRLLVVFLLCLWTGTALSADPPAPVSCDEGWTLHGKTCFLFVADYPTTQSGAMQICRGHDANLGYAETEDQLTFLQNTVKSMNQYAWWFGVMALVRGYRQSFYATTARGGYKQIGNGQLTYPPLQSPRDPTLNCLAWTYTYHGFQVTHEPCRVEVNYICTGTLDSVINANYDDARWKKQNGTKAVFYFSSIEDRVNYQDATDNCTAKGMNLMVLTSKDDVSFLFQNLRVTIVHRHPIGVWWMGLKRQDKDYVWPSGSTDVSFLPMPSSKYVGMSASNTLMLTANGLTRYWGSRRDKSLPFICKKSAIGGSDVNFGCPKSWLRGGQSCYIAIRLLSQPLNFDESAARCKTFGGAHLLAINSQDELNYLSSDAVSSLSYGIGTSLNDRDTAGKYVWFDGSPADSNLIKWSHPLMPADSLVETMSSDASQGMLCTIYYAYSSRLRPARCDSFVPPGCHYQLPKGQTTCPSGWHFYQDQKSMHCYYTQAYTKTRMSAVTWDTSLSRCYSFLPEGVDDSNIKMSYIDITSSAIRDFINSVDKKSLFWTGLSTSWTPPVLKWSDLSDVDYDLFSANQPDSADAKCTSINEGGYFSHMDCDRKLSRLICEKEIAYTAPTTPPVPIGTDDPEKSAQKTGTATGIHPTTTWGFLTSCALLLMTSLRLF